MKQPQQEATVLIANPMFMVVLISACAVPSARQVAAPDTAEIRKTIEALYERNANAYLRHDFEAIMALRTPDFHAILPDGTMRDRAAMENYIQGFLNGVKKWNRLEFTLDSVRVEGDTAFVIASQHLDRMALRADNAVHHVETWVTQRETWVRGRDSWLMWRVDQLRNQRRLVDGKPE